MVLYMDIAGKRNIEIAEQLGYAPEHVSSIRASPLYQAQRAELVAKLQEGNLDDLRAMIRGEAPRNFDWLRRMRDDATMHLGDPNARIRAAAKIEDAVDRVYPKISKTEIDHTVKLEISDRAAAIMERALRNDAIDVTPPALPSLPPPPVAAPSPAATDPLADGTVKSIDDYAAELAAGDADEEDWLP